MFQFISFKQNFFFLLFFLKAPYYTVLAFDLQVIKIDQKWVYDKIGIIIQQNVTNLLIVYLCLEKFIYKMPLLSHLLTSVHSLKLGRGQLS